MERVKLDPKVLKGLKKYRDDIENLYSSGMGLAEISKTLKRNYGFSVEPFVIGYHMADWGVEFDTRTRKMILFSKTRREGELKTLAPLKKKILRLYLDDKKSPDSITRILKLEDGFTYSNAVVKSFLTYYCPEVEMRNWEESMDTLNSLSPEQVRSIREEHSEGNVTRKQLAEKYNVSRTTISDALKT